jgi:hypothetical protein
VDCIVFPVKGKRPHPSEIAGSDLDGDKYFVSWDPDLIPKKTVPPYAYPESSAVPLKTFGKDKIIDEFVNSNPFIVGQVHTLYCKWADLKGVESKECETLSELFSVAIDSAKTGVSVKIPPELKDLPPENKPHKPPIWRILKKMAKERIKEYQNQKVERQSYEAFSSKLMLNMLLDRSSVAVSDYELWKVTNIWMSTNFSVYFELVHKK